MHAQTHTHARAHAHTHTGELLSQTNAYNKQVAC